MTATMTAKEKLEEELEIMRPIYMTARELHDSEVLSLVMSRVSEIKEQLQKLCYTCRAELRNYNEYYCSKECNDKYYPIIGKRTIEGMKQQLVEISKRQHTEQLKIS